MSDPQLINLPVASVRSSAAAPAALVLRPKQEAFAQAFVSYGNASRAYREAFDCSPTMRANTIRRMAYDLVHSPNVAARVRELAAEAADDTIVSARVRMVRLQQIAEADPSELVSITASNCRYCWGDGSYVWRDPVEYARALDRYTRLKGSPRAVTEPEHSSSYGWHPDREPDPNCLQCDGRGVVRTVLTPSDQLSPAARALLKGVRQKADGTIELQLHDQLAASDQLNKMDGSYVERRLNINATVPVPKLENMTPEQAVAFLKTLVPG